MNSVEFYGCYGRGGLAGFGVEDGGCGGNLAQELSYCCCNHYKANGTSVTVTSQATRRDSGTYVQSKSNRDH